MGSDAMDGSPFDMMTDTDILAMKRIMRLLGRIRAECDRHLSLGHDQSCPFANSENVEDVQRVGDTIFTWIAIYEENHGDVPVVYESRMDA